VTPKFSKVTGHPVPKWIRATSLNLECLRLALIDRHRDAFDQAAILTFDPSSWMARALDAHIDALIRTMELYAQAERLADELDDVEF